MLNVPGLAVAHVRPSVEIAGIVVNDLNLAILRLAAVQTLQNGPYCLFEILNGDVLRQLVDLLTSPSMKTAISTEKIAFWIVILVFCNINSY